MPETLSSGMTLAEALKHARPWWGEFRVAVKKDFNRVKGDNVFRGPKSNGKLTSPAFIIKGEVIEQDIQSGILSGYPWDMLTVREQRRIAEHWHDNFVAGKK